MKCSVLLELRGAEMDMLAHCRAMAAFCRQQAKIDENKTFWLEEAEQWASLTKDAAMVKAPNTVRTESVKRASA